MDIGPETLRVIHQNNGLTVQRGLGQQYIILELFESFSVEAVSYDALTMPGGKYSKSSGTYCLSVR